MKILYITTIGSTMGFFEALIKELIEQGNTVDIATNESEKPVPNYFNDLGCKVYPLSCSRSPLDKGNLTAVKEIRKIVKDGKYDIVHCHTPIAAACTRLACRRLRKTGIKVFYTAHGFHFFKGAPLKNWLIYYPVERLCARWTDVLITINKEDFERASRKFKAGKVEYVPGVGIETQKFANTVVDKASKRCEIGVPEDAFMLLSVGELNENKNHRTVIKALSEIGDTNIHYVIAGQGDKKDELEKQAKEMKVNLHLLGRRTDVAEIYKCADVDIFPSIREGLGLAAIEGMASGLPLICADNRGTREYAEKSNAVVCPPLDVDAFANAVRTLKNDAELCERMGESGKEKAKSFSIECINEKMKNIYFSDD